MDAAVLFDLDDTLVDLQYARRHGLRAVQEILPELKPVPLEELELVSGRRTSAGSCNQPDRRTKMYQSPMEM